MTVRELKRPRNKLKHIPPLENGDRLTRREFERRYKAMPQVRKVELIEGVVFMSSPVHQESHSRPNSYVVTLLGNYVAATPGCDLGENATVRLDLDNEVQPEALLRIETKCGGHSHISDDDFIEGPPELIVEIAASSATHDLGDKLRAYRRNGVQEYIVWQIYDEKVDWFELREGEYVLLAPDPESGLRKSNVFPGLWLSVKALLEGDLATVLAELQKGLASPEYVAFVEKLASN